MASHAPTPSIRSHRFKNLKFVPGGDVTFPYIFKDDPHELGVRLAIGLRGSGKSSLLEYQLHAIEKLKSMPAGRIILVDPTRDDFHFKNFGYGPIYRPVDFVSALSKSPPKQFKIRVITKDPEFFNLICLAAMQLGDCFLLVDEVWNFCTTKQGPQMQPFAFNVLACEGRHRRVRLIATCQRPTQVHNNMFHLSDELNIFRTKDLNLLASELETKENLARARRLPKFHFFTISGPTMPREVVLGEKGKNTQHPVE